MNLTAKNTAVVFTTPQVDLLKPEGVIWELVKETVTKNNVIENLVNLRNAAHQKDIPVFYSLLKFSDKDYDNWQHLSTIQSVMFENRVLAENSSGSDIIEELKPNENDIILSTRKGFSAFWSTDLNIQLRKRNIQNIILAGMAANLCIESHLRDAIENGYNVYVVKDAVGAAGEEALNAAYVNYTVHATDVVTTKEAINSLLQTEAIPAE